MTDALDIPETHRAALSGSGSAATHGKFLAVGGARFLVKGVTYGTFAPASDGSQFPSRAVVRADFDAMRQAGLNTVRVTRAR